MKMSLDTAPSNEPLSHCDKPNAVWCTDFKLGIRHERIEPGKPQQNGRHERMHRTLKLETASPPRVSWRAQQRAFDRFRNALFEQIDERCWEVYYGHVSNHHQRPHPSVLWFAVVDPVTPRDVASQRVRISDHIRQPPTPPGPTPSRPLLRAQGRALTATSSPLLSQPPPVRSSLPSPQPTPIPRARFPTP
jgi:hypothetical protein